MARHPGAVAATLHRAPAPAVVPGAGSKNRSVLRYREGEGFNEEETDLFLKGVTAGELPAATREKLGRNGMLDVLDVLPRNLKILLS
ncbi:MAG: hypothetical protein WCF08_02800 [Anaerolineaceae bacterium]